MPARKTIISKPQMEALQKIVNDALDSRTFPDGTVLDRTPREAIRSMGAELAGDLPPGVLTIRFQVGGNKVVELNVPVPEAPPKEP